MVAPMVPRTLLVTALLLAAPAFAAPAPAPEASIHLITIGPAGQLPARFGHTGLMVMETKPGQKKFESTVYNFGDADFDTWTFYWQFLRGTVKFRMISTGDLASTVGIYGNQDRTIHDQRLALTPAQVRQLKTRLEWLEQPENRDYPYHFLRASCATKARDLLDEVLGGAIRRQLEARPDLPVRHYARQGYAGFLLAEVFNDLFMGRLMDGPRNQYESLYLPSLVMKRLQEVKVPDPRGGSGLVPLAEPPNVLFQREGPSPTPGDGRGLVRIAYALLGLLLLLGIVAFAVGPRRPRWAGLWLLLWSVPAGLAAILMLLGALLSTVIEGRVNELMLVFPITDLALWRTARRWYRRRAGASRLLRGYALVRLALVLLALLGHAVGLLVQQPLILVWLGLVCAAGLVLLTRRLAEPGPQ
jgi:hypothetical protein